MVSTIYDNIGGLTLECPIWSKVSTHYSDSHGPKLNTLMWDPSILSEMVDTISNTLLLRYY